MAGLIGRRLGQYEIVALLGEGGMAAVYRARQPSIGREVALKVIKPDLLDLKDLDKRFSREARTIAALSHPHILKIFDYSQDENIAYLVTELLTGGSLAQVLDGGPLSPENAVFYLEQIASALDYAHAQGVIHRDLKPQNVLLDGQGFAFLTDFGIATLLKGDATTLTQTGAAVGTPAYMSPEQWQGEAIDHRTDIYALGVMLFQMLSGTLPFKADTPYEMMYAHVNLQPHRLDTLQLGLPTDINRVIGKALAKDQAERFATASALVAAFKQALTLPPISAQTEADLPQFTPDRPDLHTVSMGASSRQASQPGNPFFNRSAIRGRAYFVNRDHEVRQVLSLLKNGQSVSLVGQRRIGKTSLLFHVATPDIFTQHSLNPDEHLFVYVDCGGLADLDHAGIYRALLEEAYDAQTQANLNLEMPHALQSDDPVSYRSLDRSLRDWLRRGHKLIFLLDEFERMSRNPALDPDFFSGLRALATRHAIAFVTASKQPLLELTYAHSSALSSPFFNIFATIRLTLFSEETARALIQRLAAMAELAFSEPTINAILTLAGTHPLFLQIAGYEAFELQQTKGDSLDETDFPELQERFLSSVEEHFAYYWRSLTPAQQQTLAALHASQSSDLDTLRSLEQQSLIVRLKEGYDCFSPLFQTFVQSQSVPGLVRAGPIVIDERRRRVVMGGQPLALSELQYDLLLYLAARPDEVVTNEELERAIWGDEFVEDPERLKSVVKGLRRALGDEAARLENVRGVGYTWRVSS